MDDYIFLIIAILLSVFGAINQNKKKKAAESRMNGEKVKPRNFFLSQFLEDDFLEESKSEPEEILPPKLVKPAPPKIATIPISKIDIQTGGNFQLTRFRSTLPDRPKHETITTFKKQKEEDEVEETEEPVNYIEDFSLRKAIIYSQILERKY